MLIVYSVQCMYNFYIPTFPESVKPVKMKLISSPLLHLSVVPSMFNSTLFGSETQHIYNPVTFYYRPVGSLQQMTKYQ